MITFPLDLQFFAKHGGGGSASTNCSHKSYNPNNQGVKKFGGEYVKGGNIIVRQHGTKYKIKKDDKSVFMGKNYTIHAKHEGIVNYYYRGGRKERTFISVLPLAKSE
ncbi:MAG: 50S ribosomal protein L27 [Candidatus Moeniiplasma glomeromycotorum]|nr:50S ribosomal protein L27 [Candidatus Moeniiplasma glomeromycotorum]